MSWINALCVSMKAKRQQREWDHAIVRCISCEAEVAVHFEDGHPVFTDESGEIHKCKPSD